MNKPLSNSPGRLHGKVALVTGIGSGIGRGCALRFASEGARVIGCDINLAAAQETVELAGQAGTSIDAVYACDLTDPHAVRTLFDSAIAASGGIDVVVNAAATAVFAWLPEMDYADWRKTLAGELDTVFLVSQAAWPHLVARGGGAVINFASVNAYMALQGSAAVAHCAGKGGVLAMTRQLAMEGAPHGIRVNTISPGFVVTGATLPVLDTPGFTENVLNKKMIKRFGTPDDIAWCATFLASDEAGWITASDFAVDGGARAW